MDLRLRARLEQLRGSLFFVPMVFVLIGGALGQAMISLDSAVGDGAGDLPFVLTSTVDSAREVLSMVGTATLTVAGIAFSVSLLVIQQAANQYSPRVVHSLFLDPFNRRVMGVVLGTFTYCLVALRAVRGPLEEGGDPVVPNLTVALAVLLGVVAILAIVAFIDHSAHSMEVSQILRRVTEETTTQLERAWPDRDDGRDADDVPTPDGEGHVVRFTRSGWLQQLAGDRLLGLVPDGGTVRMEIAVGRYAVQGAPLCTVWPAPGAGADLDELARRATAATHVGPVRTMQDDPSYGIRQIVDVALRALSPGINDPTTAQDAIFHLAQVLQLALGRDVPSRVEQDDRGRRLLHAEAHTHETLIDLAFEELRRASAAMPRVTVYLLEAQHLLHESMRHEGRPELADLLQREAGRVVEGARHADLLPVDLQQVEDAHASRFGATGPR